jgi:hypothetical protein
MTSDDNETIADATIIIATDDTESSLETIIERPQGEPASGDGGGNDGKDHKPDGTVPFARSSFYRYVQHSRCYPMGSATRAVARLRAKNCFVSGA